MRFGVCSNYRKTLLKHFALTGKYQDKAGRSFCWDCEKDTASLAAGSSSCDKCKSGFGTVSTGSASCVPITCSSSLVQLGEHYFKTSVLNNAQAYDVAAKDRRNQMTHGSLLTLSDDPATRSTQLNQIASFGCLSALLDLQKDINGTWLWRSSKTAPTLSIDW
jgi:hypothetical protein